MGSRAARKLPRICFKKWRIVWGLFALFFYHWKGVPITWVLVWHLFSVHTLLLRGARARRHRRGARRKARNYCFVEMHNVTTKKDFTHSTSRLLDHGSCLSFVFLAVGPGRLCHLQGTELAQTQAKRYRDMNFRPRFKGCLSISHKHEIWNTYTVLGVWAESQINSKKCKIKWSAFRTC